MECMTSGPLIPRVGCRRGSRDSETFDQYINEDRMSQGMSGEHIRGLEIPRDGKHRLSFLSSPFQSSFRHGGMDRWTEVWWRAEGATTGSLS